jgi:hypothetical protein
MEVQPLHSMKDSKTTRCGLTVSHGDRGTSGEQAPVFIAPSAGEATCIDCKHATTTIPTRSQQIVSDRLDQEAERFAERRGAPPPEPPEGIDPAEVAQRVLDKQKGAVL